MLFQRGLRRLLLLTLSLRGKGEPHSGFSTFLSDWGRCLPVLFSDLFTATLINYIPGYGGTVAFGFGGVIAIVSMLLLAIKIKEPPRGSL